MVLYPFEKVGVVSDVVCMREFSNWIQDLGMIDIPLHGIKFTWRRNESKSKLDRALWSNEWLRVFPNLRLIGLNRCTSDHNPLALLSEAIANWGSKPFRCFDAWFLNPEFRKFVRREWNNLAPSPMNNKLKVLKGSIRNWSLEKFADLDLKIKNLEAVIHDLDLVSEDKVLNCVELARLNAAQSHLQAWIIRRERIWRQKVRSYGFS